MKRWQNFVAGMYKNIILNEIIFCAHVYKFIKIEAVLATGLKIAVWILCAYLFTAFCTKLLMYLQLSNGVKRFRACTIFLRQLRFIWLLTHILFFSSVIFIRYHFLFDFGYECIMLIQKFIPSFYFANICKWADFPMLHFLSRQTAPPAISSSAKTRKDSCVTAFCTYHSPISYWKNLFIFYTLPVRLTFHANFFKVSCN